MIAFLMGLRTVSPADLHRMLTEGGATAIDVNSPGSWLRARVPGAVKLDPSAPDFSVLPADKTFPLVFYCSNPMCRKAPTAALRARKLGYEDVRVMSAGIQGWVDARLPVESGAAG